MNDIVAVPNLDTNQEKVRAFAVAVVASVGYYKQTDAIVKQADLLTKYILSGATEEKK